MRTVRTFSYRIKDSTSHKPLCRTAGAVSFVWSDWNKTSHRAIRKRDHFFRDPELDKLTAGSSKLLLHPQTTQAITKEHLTQRIQHKKAKLRWH